jgi:hypothetical protein
LIISPLQKYRRKEGIDIDKDLFFALIEHKSGEKQGKVGYKADFATDLFDELKDDEVAKNFILPKYIEDGFEFLYPHKKENNESNGSM